MAGQILHIASDLTWNEHVHTVLDFMDYETVPVTSLDALRTLDPWPSALVAVFVGDCGAGAECAEAVRMVREHVADVPVFRLIDKNHVGSNSDESDDAAIQIDLPLRQAQIAALLGTQTRGTLRVVSPGVRRSLDLHRSLVGESAGVARVRRMIEQVADSDASVLILGESGTGKEVVARKLHYLSPRRDKPFVPINCGAIPADLLESELFGHEKGAFTGAINARPGRFEMAEGGTLFLDEIGDMSLHMQVKLLRVLQERMFERVGSNRSIRADVRIIAATHRNLEEQIQEGKFREDLFYRLNVFPIEMPSLRERSDDVPALIEELSLRLRNEKRVAVRFTPAAVNVLSRYPWPGNVRELANLVERLAILHPNGTVDVQNLPPKYTLNAAPGVSVPAVVTGSETVSPSPFSIPRLPREGLDIKEHLNNLEYTLIKQALDDAGGVVAHAAERLRLRRTTLVEKLRKYGLARTEEVSGF